LHLKLVWKSKGGFTSRSYVNKSKIEQSYLRNIGPNDCKPSSFEVWRTQWCKYGITFPPISTIHTEEILLLARENKSSNLGPNSSPKASSKTCMWTILTLQRCHLYSQTYHKRCQFTSISCWIRLIYFGQDKTSLWPLGIKVWFGSPVSRTWTLM
jgi:hypothetical protein